MKLSVNIPTAILIILVVFYTFIIFSHFTKNMREGLENQDEENLEETDMPEEVDPTDLPEEEETILSQMTRIESEIEDLESEIEKRNKVLEDLKKTIDETEEEPVKE